MELAQKAKTLMAYQPQVDVNTPAEDDPDNYMMLVPATRKRPVIQMSCAALALLLAIIGLALDEMSDGDVRFTESLSSEDFLDEVDYDCGWRSFRVNYIYYETEAQIGDGAIGQEHWAYEQYKYDYSGSFCEDRDSFIDKDFCEESITNGMVWLVCGVLGVIFYFVSLPAVWFQGKGSVLYVVMLALGTFCMTIASLNWLFNDKCEDIEEWPEEEATFDTTLGASMVLAFVSIFCAIIGMLVSSVHLMAPVQQRRAEQRLQDEQPRIQSTVVPSSQPL